MMLELPGTSFSVISTCKWCNLEFTFLVPFIYVEPAGTRDGSALHIALSYR